MPVEPTRLLRTIFLASAFLLATLSGAFAHAQLLSTEPLPNAVLSSPPDAVRLNFNEPVSALKVTLIRPDGTGEDILTKTRSGERVVITLPDLGQGTHVISYRVVSEDGHPIGGSLIFSVGAVTGASPTSAAIVDPLVAPTVWLAKSLFFICLFLGVGGAAFAAFVAPPSMARQSQTGAAAAGLLIAPLTIGLQGLDAFGLPLAGLFTGEAWAGGMATSYGTTALCATVAFLLALLAPLSPAPRLLGVLAWLSGALALALSGHASAAEPQWLTRPAVFLHLFGILFWIGALPALFIMLARPSTETARTLAVFSRVVPYAVAPIVLSGLVLAAIQLGAPGPQWLSPYAAVLVNKLVLLAVLFGLAIWNRMSLTGPVLAGDSVATARLRRSVGIEMLIVLVIVGLVAGWRFTPPPRALAEVVTAPDGDPVYVHMMHDNTMAMLTFSSETIGPTSVEIMVTDAEGMPVSPEAVSVTLSQLASGIEPFKVDAVNVGEDVWRLQDLLLPVPGTWEVAVDVRLSRFALVKLTGTVDITAD